MPRCKPLGLSFSKSCVNINSLKWQHFLVWFVVFDLMWYLKEKVQPGSVSLDFQGSSLKRELFVLSVHRNRQYLFCELVL